jgi:hypothetical protein
MRSEEEIRAALGRMRESTEAAIKHQNLDTFRGCSVAYEALEWVMGADNAFARLLYNLSLADEFAAKLQKAVD